jgi:hypothetical protein
MKPRPSGAGFETMAPFSVVSRQAAHPVVIQLPAA